MSIYRSAAVLKHSLVRYRGAKLLLGAGAIVIASSAMGGPLASAATHSSDRLTVVPTNDIVGAGLVQCTKATGEVGYSPASIAGGGGPLTISIWFRATGCSSGQPTPKTVIGSMSFQTTNTCPLLSPPALGSGTLNLAYNYPPVPNPMIDPSVGQNVTVTQSGPYWVLTGSVVGSYPSSNLQIWLKPVPIGGQNCGTGITSEYISRTQGPVFLSNI
jgi:hypothetical protein